MIVISQLPAVVAKCCRSNSGYESGKERDFFRGSDKTFKSILLLWQKSVSLEEPGNPHRHSIDGSQRKPAHVALNILVLLQPILHGYAEAI